MVSNADEISINIEQDDSSLLCDSSLKAHSVLPSSILKTLEMKVEQWPLAHIYCKPRLLE